MAPPTTKAGWMDPTIRAWLVATRPWSLPGSVVPVCLCGAVLHRNRSGTDDLPLYSAGFVLAFVVVVAFHLAANLFNTYFDFVSGLDTKEEADDRALVDGTVSTSFVWRAAVGAAAVGSAAAAALAALRGWTVLLVAVPAVLVAFLYSADPFSLKGHGLGEATVFVMFGPLLVAGVNVAVLEGHIDWMSMGYSIPLGVLTAAILFANNIRDVEADKRANKITLPNVLGPARSAHVFRGLLGAGYGSVALLGVWHLTPMHQGLVLGCVPWACYLARRVDLGLFHELPQSVAQHNLLFGALLTAALAEPMFTIRVLVACLYALGGINNIVMWQYNRALVHMKLTNVVPGLPQWLTERCFAVATAGQIVTAVPFMLGYHTILMAHLLLTFVVPVTFLVHDMWTIEHDHPAHVDAAAAKKASKLSAASRSVAIFPTEFDNEFVHFFKNVGMIGALYLYIAVH